MSEYQDKYRRIATTAIPSVFGSALHVRLNVIAGVILPVTTHPFISAYYAAVFRISETPVNHRSRAFSGVAREA
ncbi:hypothetical protein ACN5L9_002144 [Cronobacter sakazakii]|uniref:hypothetical protein n=1 Tax=Cronobacter TaxID=413496 RepID=UPI001015F029|nr:MULTISPECIES: hypothetical protein [Cronobacter]EJJ0548595.1 hypothetical protein [Cronobacter sakazakii]ELY6082361.1 hypothetical protein [Cronobacter sakazakii]MBF4937596.1 hypothetical protein [Cronobacter sakazakii]MBK4112688.1 hypothetical protein [Cronobacter sakazakii]MDI7679133.1 hypothetical protein [Cronobacter sakazakii]